LTKLLKYVIIRYMQKKTNYFLFIVQGRGFHQRLELDCLGVVPRHNLENKGCQIADRQK
jgi:hypothetical protein